MRDAYLRCTICKKVKKSYSEITYSQGDRVCLNCKKKTLESDKKAFDRDMELGRYSVDCDL